MNAESPSQFWILTWLAPKCATVQEKSLDSSGDQQEKSNVFRIFSEITKQ